MQAMECSLCQTERERRNRVIAADDARVRRLASLILKRGRGRSP